MVSKSKRMECYRRERVVIEEKVSGLFPRREEMDDYQNASEWNVIQWRLEGHLAIEFTISSRYEKVTMFMMMEQVS
jgi:hypothetical protein